jgi:hypothetical protein
MRLVVRAGALVVALVIAVACADFSGLEDPTFGLPDVAVPQPSFASDVQPIFTKRCVVGGCHTLASQQGGLALDSTVAYDQLVGVPATTTVDPMDRVEPGDAANSWLVRRLHPDPAQRNGQPRMPLAATPLTDNQLTTIVNWINEGAQRN